MESTAPPGKRPTAEPMTTPWQYETDNPERRPEVSDVVFVNSTANKPSGDTDPRGASAKILSFAGEGNEVVLQTAKGAVVVMPLQAITFTTRMVSGTRAKKKAKVALTGSRDEEDEEEEEEEDDDGVSFQDAQEQEQEDDFPQGCKCGKKHDKSQKLSGAEFVRLFCALFEEEGAWDEIKNGKSRGEIDARNTKKGPWELVSERFHDESWKPILLALPDPPKTEPSE